MNLELIARIGLDLGFDPRKISNIKEIPRYLAARKKWRARGGEVTASFPIFSDLNDTAGAARGHYFHQDLLVATFIHQHAPQRHVDIGSRIDGFVAHVAAFRQIDVLDIRPLGQSPHSQINFVQADVMQPLTLGATDSISCLHALEHFGLGRYGDPINPEGHLAGLANIIGALDPGGRLYISFPISAEDRVYFNAHRTFHPASILDWAAVKEHLVLRRFDYVDDSGDLHCDCQITEALGLTYGCGIYSFEKNR